MKRTKTPSLDQSKLQQLPPPQLHICCKKRADFVKATGLFEMEFPGLGPPGTWRIPPSVAVNLGPRTGERILGGGSNLSDLG